MLAGTGRTNITPQHSVWMGGMLHAQPSIGVHNRLFARALALGDDREAKMNWESYPAERIVGPLVGPHRKTAAHEPRGSGACSTLAEDEIAEAGKALVQRQEIRLAMLGMVEGNGHPYSWSAIFNGYDPEEMAKCPFAGIPIYLSKEPKDTLRIPDVRVTHIWTDDPAEARHVAKASLIPNVVERPEDVIGQVDAVIIATDKGHEHVARCKPFVEAGLPIFVDKPMVDNEADLRTFSRWIARGAAILSSSCMRYGKEFMPYRCSTHELGAARFACITTSKSWERYGIHALEGIYPILGPGFLTARNTGTLERNVVHLKHRCGADVIVVASMDMYGGFGALQLCGTAGHAEAFFTDTFYAFKTQLQAFIDFLRTGKRPFPFSETQELMKLVIAGTRSREEGGREVKMDEISTA